MRRLDVTEVQLSGGCWVSHTIIKLIHQLLAIDAASQTVGGATNEAAHGQPLHVLRLTRVTITRNLATAVLLINACKKTGQ